MPYRIQLDGREVTCDTAEEALVLLNLIQYVADGLELEGGMVTLPGGHKQIDDITRNRIAGLLTEGVNLSEIVRQTGVSRKTVARIRDQLKLGKEEVA